MNTIIQTKFGRIEGVHSGIPSVMVYRGVPYAAPPVGPLRFMPPRDPEPWEGIRKCHDWSPISLQPTMTAGLPFSDFFLKEFYPYEEPRSEDSLYLNIWTPAKSEDDKLPVMFWIHGGGLGSGFGHEMEFDGEAMAKKGVILVTINYRLGHIGFFAHPEISAKNPHKTSGNNTILDMVQALKWVRENIAAFGGDPDNVTVFGQSGGAAATSCLLQSPLAEGLFHKAILQSGITGIDLHTYGHDTLEYAENWGVKVCEVLGMTLDDLMALPAKELLDKLVWAEANGAGRRPGESLDGYVFTHFPQEGGYDGYVRDVPIMTGGVHGDVNEMFHIREFDGRPDEEIAFKCFARSAYREFLETWPPADNPELYDYMRELEYIYNGISFGDKQYQRGGRMPYLYYFDAWIPGENESHFVPEGESYHSVELWFTFGTLHRCWRPFDGRYYDLSEKMVSYWTNFAKKGDPNGKGLPEWLPYDPDRRNVMHMNEVFVRNEAQDSKYLDIVLNFFRTHDCR